MGWGGKREGCLGWGTHVNPWLIHVNVWQNPLQYCKVISLQLKNNNNNKNQPWNNRVVPNRKRNTSRLYIVTLLIYLIWDVCHVKSQAGWSTIWNQDSGRNNNNLRYAHDPTLIDTTLMAYPYGIKRRRAKEPLDESERREWKCWLKTQHSKTKIMASSPITSWWIDGKQCKQWQILFPWTPKSLQLVIPAMKLKDACSLEEKLWQT